MRRRIYTQDEIQAIERDYSVFGLFYIAGVDLICVMVNTLPRSVRSFMKQALLVVALAAFLVLVLNRGGAGSWKEEDYRVASSDTISVNAFASESATKDYEEESIRDKIFRIAPKHGLDPWLVYAVITQESNHNIEAISHKGATGLMQIMPATAKQECGLAKEDLKDPDNNINCGCSYLRKQLDTFGSLDYALASYNAGPTATSRYKRERGTIPPYPETEKYVIKILIHYGNLSLDASKTEGQFGPVGR